MGSQRRLRLAGTSEDPRSDPPSPTAGADAALRASGAGDQAAFAEFYDLMAGVVHGVVLRVIRNPAMAEEVTQEVFLELWRLAPRFESSKGSSRSWAATIARRRAIDRVRSEASARAREDRDGAQQDVPHDSVAEQVTAQLDRDDVACALEQLSTAQRDVIMLAYYGGHTYKQVAVLLDIPEGTAKTRIRDGLTTLRRVLAVST